MFSKPTRLLPSRGPFDHNIPQKGGSDHINLKTYMYSASHKDIIEGLIEKMLDQGIEQPIPSPMPVM